MLLEKSLDGFGSHLIEVVRNSDFAFHKSQTTMDSNFVGIEWHNLDQRLTGFGDDKRFPPRRLIDQAGQMGLGFVDVNDMHGACRE